MTKESKIIWDKRFLREYSWHVPDTNLTVVRMLLKNVSMWNTKTYIQSVPVEQYLKDLQITNSRENEFKHWGSSWTTNWKEIKKVSRVIYFWHIDGEQNLTAV